MSHSTRAYAHNCIANQGGLQGFLVPSIIKILRNAEADEMEVVTKYQHVDIGAVINKLENMPYSSELKLNFLGREYPCLLIFVLKKRGAK